MGVRRAALAVGLLLLLLTAVPASAAITFFGRGVNPADGGSGSANPTAVTPPASMAAGDLVVLSAAILGTSKTLAISEAGGQTWTSETQHDGNGLCTRIFWAEFNGTWSADPSVGGNTAAEPMTVMMGVFRPNDAATAWAIDVAKVSANLTAASPHTITGVTRIAAEAVAVAAFFISDNNALDTLGGTGWTRGSDASGGYQNNAGGTFSTEWAYNIGSGATNDVTITDNGPDTGVGWIIAFSEAVSFSLEQEGFAFGDDDGNEATHTLDTQDANVEEALGVKTLRVIVNATGDPGALAYTLRSQKNGSGGYVAVPLAATTETTPTPTTDQATESGNNTEQATWAVSYPNASTGDLIIFGISWDDSTTTTDVSEPAGPNSEVLSEVNATPCVSSSTEVRAKVWYTIATGTWTASTLTFTPSATESWSAAVLVIPAGQFDATTPIGASTTNASAGSETAIVSAAFSAGSTDGGGRVFAWTAADADPQTLAADWTQIANQDLGAVTHGMFTRDAVVSDSESIAADTVSTIVGDTWCSVSFVVRGVTVTNEVYVSASANVTASGEATTARLTAPSGKTSANFTDGRRWDDENGTDTLDIVDDEYTEVEWVLTTQSPATAGDYFEFRVYQGASVLDTYTVTAKWTIPGGVAGCTGSRLTLTGAGC